MQQIILAFVTGLTTGGLSCLAVQGGLLASSIAHDVEKSVQNQPAPARRTKVGPAPRPQQLQPHASRPILLFLAAKLVAYTLLGFLLGLLGSVLQLTPIMRAVLLAAIGIFMVGSALRMLNVHPIFRYFVLEPPSFVTRYIRRKSKSSSSALAPLFLGALTVLIPCGVTQAMMAVAMGTGNPVTGAVIMFAFVLGTSPVFFTVAYLATRLGAKLEKNFSRIVAAIMLILGLISLDSGLTLAGWPYSVSNLRMAAVTSGPAPAAASVQPQASGPAPVPAPGADTAPDQSAGPVHFDGASSPASSANVSADDVVTITVTNTGYQPELTRASAGRPFQLALVTRDTQSCALAFVIPSLKIQKMLPSTGTVMIDIPAQQAGSKLFYSCSMGMYSGVIVFEG